jgi:hypothetical protein
MNPKSKMKRALCFLLFFATAPAWADQDAKFIRTKVTDLSCWQIRAILNPSASTTMDLTRFTDRWRLSFIVACDEKDCLGKEDRFEQLLSDSELESFLKSAGCEFKPGSTVGSTEKECLKQALLLKLQKEQGLTDYQIKLLRQKAQLPKPVFTMQCRDEAQKTWFQKKLESWLGLGGGGGGRLGNR